MLQECQWLFTAQNEADLAAQVGQALRGEAIPTPDDFKGGEQLQMFALDLSLSDGQKALAAVEKAVHAEQMTPGTAHRGLGGFVEAWREYVSYLDA